MNIEGFEVNKIEIVEANSGMLKKKEQQEEKITQLIREMKNKLKHNKVFVIKNTDFLTLLESPNPLIMVFSKPNLSLKRALQSNSPISSSSLSPVIKSPSSSSSSPTSKKKIEKNKRRIFGLILLFLLVYLLVVYTFNRFCKKELEELDCYVGNSLRRPLGEFRTLTKENIEMMAKKRKFGDNFGKFNDDM